MKDMSNNTDAPIAGTVGAGKLTDLPKVCDEILRAVKPDTDFGFVRIAGSYTGIREYNLVALVNDHAQLLSENAELRAEVERLKEENRMVLTPADEADLIENVMAELSYQLAHASDHKSIEHVITAAIKEWFQVRGEDQTAGMPEYENHRY